MASPAAQAYFAGPEFLNSCLTLALEDVELVAAVSEIAQSNGLNAVSLGKGLLSVETLQRDLFLTRDEAVKVLDVCKSMTTGDKPQAEASDSAVSLRLFNTTSGRLSVRISIKERSPSLSAVPEQQQQPPSIPSEQPPQPASEPQQPDGGLAGDTHVVVQRTSTAGLKKPADIQPQAEAELGPSPPTPGTPALHMEPAAHPLPTPEFSASDLVLCAAPATDSTYTTPIKPAPKAAKAKPNSAPPKLRLPAEADDGLPSPISCSSPKSSGSKKATPSYLRPTASHKIRTSAEADLALTQSSPGPLLPRVDEDPKRAARRRNLFARMASTLLVPTQAFVARVTGRNEDQKAKKEVPITKASLQLDAVLSSPQGQRVTKAQPFALRAELRPKSCVLSKEELDLIEARENQWKRNTVPKHVHETRAIVPSFKSTPKSPQDLFEPFNLASLDRHQKQMETLKKKHDEEEVAKDEARKFKARELNQKMIDGPLTPPKPAAAPVTRGSAPVFASEDRIRHYHEVVEPVKKAKEAEANKEKLEAERRAKELEEMSVAEFRKTLCFKAMPLPDFSSPFRPDPALAKPVTSGAEPKLRTTGRLGPATGPRARQDKEGDGLGWGVYNGEGYVDPFFASLRKSTSVALHGAAAKKDMRRSTAVRSSAQAGLGGGSLRVSVGSALQAAIRAAAQEAARDAKGGCTADSRRSTVDVAVGPGQLGVAN